MFQSFQFSILVRLKFLFKSKFLGFVKAPVGVLPFFQIFSAARALFTGEENQKLKSGGGKDLEEFELYLPVEVLKNKPKVPKKEPKVPFITKML